MERDRRWIRRGLEAPVTLGNLTSEHANRIRLKCDGCTDYMSDWLYTGRDMIRGQTPLLILHI
jgi:hypothetical protein